MINRAGKNVIDFKKSALKNAVYLPASERISRRPLKNKLI